MKLQAQVFWRLNDQDYENWQVLERFYRQERHIRPERKVTDAEVLRWMQAKLIGYLTNAGMPAPWSDQLAPPAE